ncbi:MAG: acyltransferase [Planctomycetes bacterium]|nr:acyltransferase [Planctomycetota bacterium]
MPSTHADFRATRVFANLDGLRAMSVLAVLLYHFEPLPWGWLRPVQQAGFFGVDVFFVLSGFLITTLLLREPPRPVAVALKAFYARRTLRILPLFYAACGLYAAAAWLRGAEAWPLYRDFLPALLLHWSDVHLAAAPEPFPYFGHSWSLAVEEKFYLLWPLAVLARGRALGAAIAVTAVVAVTIWRAALALGEPASMALEGRLWYGFDVRLDSLMWGCLLAYALHRPGSFARVSGWLRRPWVGAAALVGFVGLALDAVLGENHGLRLCVRYSLTPGLLAVLVGIVVLGPAASGLAWLRWRPLVYVGRISYGLYVLHPLAFAAVRIVARRFGVDGDGGGGDGVLGIGGRFVACVGLSVLVCAASFRWFEGPLLRWKQRFR